MILASLLTMTLCLSAALTWQVRRYALARGMLDVPNARSSHVAPTPRGGGIAFVIAFLACLAAVGLLELVPWRVCASLAGAGTIVAAIGFLDDHYQLSRRWRLAAHVTAAVWLLAWFSVPRFAIVSPEVGEGWIGLLAAAFFVVWMVNLYNFMDGIDGLASIEAVTVCAGGIVLYWIVAPGNWYWLPPAALLVAVAGFLAFNYPPAKIFMGDGGSGFLGVTLAAFALQAAEAQANLLTAWLILLGAFIVDATLTLVRRMLRGGRQFLDAHRTHAYQHAVRRFGAHAPVSLAVGAINVAWLLPLAVLVALEHIHGALGVAVAYLPLLVLALHFDAGAPDADNAVR